MLKFILFADDTNIFYEDVSVLKLQNTLNNELCKLNNWFMVNRLSLNVKKTSYIIFSNKTVCNNVILTINNEPIDKVDVMKFLGIYIDSHLNWNSQIQHVECKISRFLGILNKIKYKINMNVKLMLYSTLALGYITYCCSIWGSNYISRLGHTYYMFWFTGPPTFFSLK